MWWILRRARLTGVSLFSQASGTNNNNNSKPTKTDSIFFSKILSRQIQRYVSTHLSKSIQPLGLQRQPMNSSLNNIKARPPRKNYNQLSSNEKLDNRQQDDIHIEEAAAVESDASSTDLDERDTHGVCPPCAHDRYNNNIRRHAHNDFSDDSDYDEALTCNVCDRSFSTRRQLADHQQKKRHFGCSACDSLFPSLMALEHHKEEFQHWSDSCCSRSEESDDSDECHEDRHRLL